MATTPEIRMTEDAEEGREMLRALIKDRLRKVGAHVPTGPEEMENDQNFLIDYDTIELIAGKIKPDSTVLEIGPGVGVLTQALIAGSERYVGLELDSRFKSVFVEMQDQNQHAEFILGNALAMPLDLEQLNQAGKLQIVSNLPFSVAKHAITNIAGLPIRSAVFFLGNHLAKEITATDPQDDHFGHLSLISQQFFNTESLGRIPRGCFYPQPHTTGEIVVLTPRKPTQDDPQSRIFSQIILDAQENGRPKLQREPISVWDSITTALKDRTGGTIVIDDTLKKPFLSMRKKEVRNLVAKVPTYLAA